MKHLVILVLSIGLIVPVAAQNPDYHYAFDGNANNVASGQAQGRLFGNYGYGTDRMGRTDGSIYFDGGRMYAFPNLPGVQTTVGFWYKTATQGVDVPETKTRFGVVEAPDSIRGAQWAVFIERSRTMGDQMCFSVATSFGAEVVCMSVDTVWNHFAMAWDNSGEKAILKVYRNGVLVTERSELGRNFEVQAHFLYLSGEDKLSLCDDLRIYKRLLGDAEIATLGEGGGPNSVEDATISIRSATVFPNPAENSITLAFDTDQVVDEVRIVDNVGRIVVLAASRASIPLSTIGAGTYTALSYTKGVLIARSPFSVVR